jgi:uncharacterized protein (DUF983 family)
MKQRPKASAATGAPQPFQALLRGLVKRCPWCGQGKLFRRWLQLAKRCPRCGFLFEREGGAFLGSLALNYGVTGTAFIILLIVWLAVALPDVDLVALTVASILLVTWLPLVLYPFAKTTWAALDLILHGMTRAEDK